MKKKHKIMQLLLAFAMTLSMFGFTPAAAMAAVGSPNDGMVSPLNWVSDHYSYYFGEYNGKPIRWRVLETSGSDAFLLSDQLVSLMNFNAGNNSNKWSESDIRIFLNPSGSYAANTFRFGTAESDTIKLTSIQEANDIQVSDRMFLLSETEAKNKNYFSDADTTADSSPLPDRVSAYSSYANSYWLRTPGDSSNNVRYIRDNGALMYNVSIANLLGVRPALKLNLSSVIFASEIKADADVSKGETIANANYSAGASNTKNFKLTMVSSGPVLTNLSGPDGELTSGVSSVSISSGGSLALTGNVGGTGEKMAYKIVDRTSGSIVGYGQGNDGSSLTVGSKGLTVGGDYTLYVWAQKDNATSSHEGSEPQYFTLTVIPRTDLIVTTTADSGAGSLREAINAVNDSPGVAIIFDPALNGRTIQLSSQLPAITESVAIRGNGAAETVISAASGNRHIWIDAAVTVMFEDLTLQGPASPVPDTGGVEMASNSGKLIMKNCVVQNCYNDTYGGGIYAAGGSEFYGCLIRNNMGTQGGGGVGGILSDIKMENCTVSGNNGNSGGGIDTTGTVTLTNCTISDNIAVYRGGGVYAGTVNLTNCTVVGNSASSGGGTYADRTNLTNCTVTLNSATSAGSGVYTDVTPNIRGSIVSGNDSDDIYQYGAFARSSPPTASNNYSIIGQPSGYTLTDIFGTNSPALADNGGQTQTILLPSTSAARDKIPATASWLPATDQRGKSRPQGAAADIGSLEFTVLAITTDSLPNGEVGAVYSKTLTATSDLPITWSLAGGILPDGLTLNGATGEISGTPTANGIFSFTVKAENSAGSDTAALTITINPPVITNPIYAALGDSVPAGYGLTDPNTQSYPALLSDLLSNNGVPNTMVNFSVSGIKTGGLLAALQGLHIADPAKFTALQNAETVTLNIGGNNVLGPMIALVNQTAADLGISDLSEATPTQLMQLITALQNLDFSQHPEFAIGMSVFAADFPQIIAWLRANAPGAKIIVSTIYNPITQVVGTNVYNASEQLIGAMNTLILQGQMAGSVSNYAIADTFTAFKLAQIPVTNFNPMSGSIDIHPNADGHTLMASLHLEAYLAQIPVVTADALPNGTVGSPYSATITADNAPILFSVVSDSLPNGLTLNANTGVITGTPNDAGSFNFTVNVWNAAGSAAKSLNITIDPAVSEKLSGVITVGSNNWDSFWNPVTFGLLCKNTQTAAISANGGNGTVTIEYYLSPSELALGQLEAFTTEWQAYTSVINLIPNNKYIIYAKLTDSSDTVYINSSGIVLYTDSTAVTTSIGFTKGSGADQTADVTLNGNTVNSIMNGANTLTSGEDYTVSGGTITFKSSYLESLEVGGYTLTVYYNPLGVTYPDSPLSGSQTPAATSIALMVNDTPTYGIYGVTVSESGSITAKDVTVTLVPPQSGVPVLFVAAYDGAGRMTAVETKSVESNTIPITMNLSGAVTIKAMMWEKSTYYPLCSPKTIKWINGEWK